MKHKINLAIVGLGWVATNRHIPLALRHPAVHLYGVVDKREERLDRMTNRYGWLKSSLSKEGEMPWGDEVQAVVIATDPFSHYNLAKKMLLAGKHVLIEKPLAMSPEEAEDLHETARRADLRLCVVHNFQFARSSRRLKQLIKEGKIGDVIAVEALQLSNPRRRLPTWYEELPFGLFYDESPHLLYMLEDLAGREIELVTSSVLRKGSRSTPFSIGAQYLAGGLPLTLSMRFAAPVSEWHIAVMGSKAVGIVDLFRDILVVIPNDMAHKARDILRTTQSFLGSHLAGFIASGLLLGRGSLFYGTEIVWNRFVEAVQSGVAAPEISSTKGRRIVQLQHELMSRSLRVQIPTDEDS